MEGRQEGNGGRGKRVTRGGVKGGWGERGGGNVQTKQDDLNGKYKASLSQISPCRPLKF